MWPRELASSPCGREAPAAAAGPAWQLRFARFPAARTADVPPRLPAHTALQGYGVYRFANKYGSNVDGYSPIYTPDTWSESGESYKLGTKGLIAWAGLIVVLLGVGINLVVSTSAIGQ